MTFNQTLKKSLFDVSNSTWVTVSQSTIVATQNLSVFSPDEAVSTLKTGSVSVTGEIKTCLSLKCSSSCLSYLPYPSQIFVNKFRGLIFMDNHLTAKITSLENVYVNGMLVCVYMQSTQLAAVLSGGIELQ